ncbi:MAG: flagellar protein FlgN [Planctomycetes bacterium]|nr:flagellar protein FlgN [Planctomycetota bacterium]
MKTLSLEFDNYIDPLIDVLERDIEHIDSTLEMLDQLRGMIIKRDDKSLNLLLEKARIKTEKYASVENRRQAIRKELARIWGCEMKEMTLTKLIQILEPERSEQIRETKEKLERLLARFKTEHLSTFMLLSECSRFNEVMLSALLNGRRDEATYNRQGSMKWQKKQSIVNLQL